VAVPPLPTALPARVCIHLRALPRTRLPSRTNAALDAITYAAPGKIVLARSADAEAHALELWETMLIALFDTGQERASAIARQRLQAAGETTAKRRVAVRAAKVLLHVDAQRYWPEVLSVIEQDRDLGEEVALACATSRDERPLLANADEEQLGGVYQWLSDLFPPASDVYREGFQPRRRGATMA
jgi:hypothetical protein